MATIPPEELQYQLANIDDDQSQGLAAVNIIGVMLAIISVVLRLLSRKISGLPLKADDYTIIAALFFVVAVFISICVQIFGGGAGRHAVLVGEARIIVSLKALYAFNLLYTNAIPLIKISILLLYHRIFAIPSFRKWMYPCILFLVLFQVSTTLVDIFNCTPIKASWDKTLPNARCVDPPTLYMATAGINVATDIIILLIPLPLIWHLRIHNRQKAALTLIFGVASLACVATIFRITVFDEIYNWDLSYSYTNVGYWTMAEVYLGVVCACLPTMRPLVIRFSQSVSGSGFWSKVTASGSSEGKSRIWPGRSRSQSGAAPASTAKPGGGQFEKLTEPMGNRSEVHHEKWSNDSTDGGLPLHAIKVQNDVEWGTTR
ncbi:MAG: hypothetical protein M1817_002263 [Caeruleum heppii]|nr:MAG: hypothetical protein M1817_002263 [Caeruleum heppii]